MSPRDIHAIIKEEEARRQKYKRQQQQVEISGKAFELFSKRYTPLQVAIELNIRQSEATKYYREYWKLKGLDKLNTICKETNGKLWTFLKLYRQLIKKKRMSIDQVINSVEIAIHKLPYMETLYRQAKDEAEKMQRTIQRLANDIAARDYKISILDKIVFSCEQDCKRTEQQLQELTAQKDRLEKWIANVSNNDELKQIVKEALKAALSEKRVLISISFAAVIQTLKADPQMVKLIQNIPSANNGEQYKDNNNNILKYLELNKDRMLKLGEKNYENLVEAFTKNAIDIAISISSSLNPTLSLPQSSSTFPNSFDQIDTFRTEESESFDNSKGDIAD